MSSFSCLLLLATCLLSLSSCEKDLEVYNTETCRLNFYYDLNSRSGFNESLARTTYSFIYGSSDRERDTLWFDVQTMGFTSDHERPVTLQQLPSDGVQATITRSIIDMVEKMGLETIAEGVENNEQLNMLNQFRCNFVQGFLRGKPMPYQLCDAYLAGDVNALLKN